MQARHAEMRRAKQNAKQKEKDKLEQQLVGFFLLEGGGSDTRLGFGDILREILESCVLHTPTHTQSL